MKKLILFFILFFFIFNNTFSNEVDSNNEIRSNVISIKDFLNKERWDLDYIDYNYDTVKFDQENEIIDILITVKDKDWTIINWYNWIIDIEPIIFWNDFIFWEIPKSVEVINWEWILKIPVTQDNKNLSLQNSGLWLILTSQNKDAFWNILTFAWWWNFINVDDYINLLKLDQENNIIDNTTQTNLDQYEYTLYNPERPNIYWNKWFEINENWEFIIEFDKDYYEKLLKVYWWQWILWFDKNSKYEINLNYNIQEKWNSVFITILKDSSIIDIYKYYSSLDNRVHDNKWILPSEFHIDIDSNIVDFTEWIISNEYEYYRNKSIYYLANLDIEGLWDLFNEYSLDLYNSEDILNNMNIDYESFKNNSSYESWNWYILNWLNNNSIRFLINSSGASSDKWTNINYIEKYLVKKYNNFYKDIWDNHKLFSFDIIKNEKEINEFLIDNMYYDIPITISKNKWNLYLNNKNELFYISDTEKEINNLTLHLKNWKKWDSIDCHLDSYNNICYSWNNFNNKFPDKYLKDNIKYEKWKVYINISNFFKELKNNSILNWYIFEDIDIIHVNLDSFKFPSLKNDNILPLASRIVSPKDVNTNPFMVWFNILLALLYLITFYFTAQFFNSYFEKIATKNNINKKLSDFTTFILKTPFIKINGFLRKILEKKKNKKLLDIDEKVSNYLKTNEHKIWIILWLLFLWIIWQITVDDFDILSVKWLLTIFIMIFILWLITFFKDLVLYLLNKSKEKENLKLENIPIWFLLATIVASSWRSVWLEPNMLFWNVLKVSWKSEKIEKKLLSSNLLFKVLVITFIVWLIFWLLTLLFSPESFFYKFFIIAYFWIVNDVFFALLPFWLLWWVYIFNEKKLRIKWFIFTFIVFLFLIHTILNPEWDLQKVLDFDGNILILVWFLIFWILTALWTYLYINKIENGK